MEKNWKPAVGEGYWFVSNVFEPVRDTNDGCSVDDRIINSGNCFKTKEEAQAMADKFKAVIRGSQIAVYDGSSTQESVDDLYLLPEWCKDAAYLYDHNENEYACITSTTDSEAILVYDGDIMPITKSAKYIVDCCEEAKCKPLSDDDLRDLVGRVLTHPMGSVSMVTDFRPGGHDRPAQVYFYEDWYTAVELVNSDWHDSNYKCGNFTTER